MLMSLLREADAGNLRPRQLARAFSLIERFHFGFTVIAQKSSSGGWSFLYARLARELLNKPTDRKVEVIDDLEERLAERFPDLAEFTGPFTELRFSDQYTQQKRTIQYVLRRLYEHGSGGTHTDPTRMTIEHILPQRDEGAGRMAELGNLLWVTEELNQQLADKSFAEKRVILRKQKSIWIPPEILAAKTWTDDDIATRTTELAELAYEEIWTLQT